MKPKKVVLIGCGAVGTSFVYAALNQGLFDEYVLIDAFADLATGNAMDFEDGNVAVPFPAAHISKGDYADCADADFIVITAGVPQKPGETRLQLTERNTQIMAEIAKNVKASGFNGVTVIASNPVDVMGTVYQKITGLDEHKVIPSGTSLDSARLQAEIAKKTKVSPKSISAYVVGEHGDSSVSLFSQVMVGSLPLDKYKKLSDKQKKDIHNNVMTKAYKIINTKRATFYGIGACLARICRAVMHDENIILPVAIKTKKTAKCYIGWPTIINKNGTNGPVPIAISAAEKKAFESSLAKLEKIFEEAWEKIVPTL